MKYILNNDNLEVVGKQYLNGVGGYDGTNPDSSDDLATVLSNRGSANGGGMTNVTYNELVGLRNSSTLKPGMFYRITDYVTTTTQSNTRIAEEYHQFDVIVMAADSKTLSEEARAIVHDGDTYFTEAGANLAAWKVWYALDNDSTRFAWADADNGKGVIYRMIDEWNNDCPYDFKNIQFKHPNDTDTYPDYYYTFTWIDENHDIIDTSVFGNNGTLTYHGAINGVYGNVIKTYNDSFGICQMLNKIVFISDAEHEVAGNDGFYGCYSNSFGNYCRNNSFGNECYGNSFGDYCRNNSFGIGCSNNSFENNCYSNSFGYSCNSNSFGDNCSNNSFGSNCHSNSFGNYCSNNSFGDDCYYNSFGSSCYCNSFRTNNSTTATLLNYCRYNHFDDGCSYNIVYNTTTTGSNNQLQNININRGVSGTYSKHNTISIDTLNANYKIQVAKNSSGDIKIYCEADLIA